jgi:hypothetical protein
MSLINVSGSHELFGAASVPKHSQRTYSHKRKSSRAVVLPPLRLGPAPPASEDSSTRLQKFRVGRTKSWELNQRQTLSDQSSLDVNCPRDDSPDVLELPVQESTQRVRDHHSMNLEQSKLSCQESVAHRCGIGLILLSSYVTRLFSTALAGVVELGQISGARGR